jgi:DNA-binding beta-propeller fold protein YncE
VLVAVQGRDDPAGINPARRAVTRRVPLPGCEHDYGLSLAVEPVDLNTWHVVGTDAAGETPDVLAYDQNAHGLYVAAESGTVTVMDLRDRRLTVTGSSHLADDAHVVAVDPDTHHSYYPVPAEANRRPALLEQEPAP